MADTSLTFHPECAKNVRVTEKGKRVEQAYNYYGSWFGGAVTARPLRTGEIFTLKLHGRPEFEFGVTINSPNPLTFPMLMHQLQLTWCLDCQDEGWIIANGEVVDKTFLSKATLDALDAGDTLGLQVTDDRRLHFYVNGKDVGVAATDIPSKVYGFIDLWKQGSPAVDLISMSPLPVLRHQQKSPPVAPHLAEKKLSLPESQPPVPPHQLKPPPVLPRPARKKRSLSNVLFEVQAVGTFVSVEEGDLNFKEREILRVLESRDDGWLLAENALGERGMVPGNYVQKVDCSPPTSVQEKEKEKEKSKLSAVREIAYSELEFGDSLGIGGQGAVFRGQWKARNLSVAIKRVTGKIRHEEAGLLSKLSHPNVITFYGICTEKYPEYFIIIELAEGGSLYSMIHEKHYHLNFEESLRFVKEIAEGMSYLHQQKVIHRDLKSHNVLLTANRTIKICDFGSAKEFDHTTKQTGTGTYRWIAPEVLKGERVSLACDVFSYGMLLFEVFKQELPFADLRDIQVINVIVEGRTPTIPVSLKPYLANLMKCCWQMDPRSRPSFQKILIILEEKECPEPVTESLGATQATTDGGPAECPEPVNESHGATTNGIPAAVPLTPKDLPHLLTVLDEASGMWFPLGMKLKLDTKTLTGIATAAGNDTSTAMNFMLIRWLKSKDPPPLLQSLTAALCSTEIGLTDLSDALLNDWDQSGQ